MKRTSPKSSRIKRRADAQSSSRMCSPGPRSLRWRASSPMTSAGHSLGSTRTRSASVSSMRDRSSDSDLEKSTKAIRKLYKKQLSKMKPNEIKNVKNELIRTFKENNLIFWEIFLGCRRCSELSEVRRLFGHFFFDWIPFFRRLCSRLGLDYGCFFASPMAALCKWPSATSSSWDWSWTWSCSHKHFQCWDPATPPATYYLVLPASSHSC